MIARPRPIRRSRAIRWHVVVFRAEWELRRLQRQGLNLASYAIAPELVAMVCGVAEGSCGYCTRSRDARARCPEHGPLPEADLRNAEQLVEEFEALAELLHRAELRGRPAPSPNREDTP